MIVIEDLTQFADTPVERPLKALLQAINRSEHFLIGDADVNQVTSGFGLVGDFKAGRKGIVLSPTRSTATPLQGAVPEGEAVGLPEGRGIFVQAGRAVTVQLPLVEGERLARPCAAGGVGFWRESVWSVSSGRMQRSVPQPCWPAQ